MIFLGYERQMLDMIRESNPGMARRFPPDYAFHFENYTDKELHKILQDLCKMRKIEMSFAATELAISLISKQKFTKFRQCGIT